MLLPLFKDLIFEQLRIDTTYILLSGESSLIALKKKKSLFLSVAFTEFFCSLSFLAEYIE